MVKKMKKKNTIIYLSIIILLVIVFILILNKNSNKSKLFELNVNEVIEKIDNKESFILCVSQTTCSHCNSYKPKLEQVSKDYNIEVFYIDIDKYNEKDRNLFLENVSFDGATPITIFFKEGYETTTTNRINGNVSIEKIVDKFKKNNFIKD